MADFCDTRFELAGWPGSVKMINTLFLPELREMLASENSEGLQEFCTAMHPSRTAEFMEGLSNEEAWQVLQFAPLSDRVEIFTYFEDLRQTQLLTESDREQAAALVAEIPSDDRVDMLQDLDEEIANDLIARLPVEDRRDVQRLSQYPEGTAGAVMTSEFAKLSESLSIREAVAEVGRQSEDYETIYYLYIVDDEGHLRGLVSARQLLAGMKRPETKLSDIMETALVTAREMDDQEEVADKVAKMDLLALPIVDEQYHIVGIVTHDDIIDVVREEATEDAHRSAAVDPLDESYLQTHLVTLSWKRGMWLAILFFFALITALALDRYESAMNKWTWLVAFIPLVISSGGNSGSQSATLIITALSRGHIRLSDWWTVVRRELVMGLLLGTGLGLMALCVAPFFEGVETFQQAMVVPITLLLVVVSGTLTGSILPLIFERIGWDPAMMSNPFVAGIIDIVGIVIYLNVALMIL
jgi:magnesium transporter